ncbi:MAG TPA: flagellar basal body P-ring protein FlgI, partial [Telmatospirillum sp.]|nr:flagellar basal body P-ring protein FlgI [Telmatospirillum sp.]
MLVTSVPAHASSRIKDIANFEGVRDNMLVGYGLVVGLNGTGDTLDNAEFTRQSLIAMLERLGVNSRPTTSTGTFNLKPKDVAAVIVTASLPAYGRQGTRLDVTVSALGDSTSLSGGTLLVTPLVGADGEVYAIAQGQISSGFSASGAAASVTKGVPTSGRVANGGVIEREVGVDMTNMESVQITLRNPDFT